MCVHLLDSLSKVQSPSLLICFNVHPPQSTSTHSVSLQETAEYNTTSRQRRRGLLLS